MCFMHEEACVGGLWMASGSCDMHVTWLTLCLLFTISSSCCLTGYAHSGGAWREDWRKEKENTIRACLKKQYMHPNIALATNKTKSASQYNATCKHGRCKKRTWEQSRPVYTGTFYPLIAQLALPHIINQPSLYHCMYMLYLLAELGEVGSIWDCHKVLHRRAVRWRQAAGPGGCVRGWDISVSTSHCYNWTCTCKYMYLSLATQSHSCHSPLG